MRTNRIIQYSVMLLSISALSACSIFGFNRAPTQDMSDARQAVQAAKDSGASKVVPAAFKSAENKLMEAESYLAKRKYRDARKAARAAKEQAGMVRELGSVFKKAKYAMKNAKAVNYLWRDTGKIFKKAQGAAKKGDAAKAMKMAKKAHSQAETALNQYYLEMATYIVRSLESEGKAKGKKKSGVSAAKKALGQKKGKKAYDIAKKL